MKTILYLSDLYFKANGRNYYEEDLYLISKLKDHFNILIGHPQQAIALLESADLIVFRNTGAVIGYQCYFERFVKIVQESKVNIFNSFDGKADIQGKQYLLDLMKLGYPVIPTIESVSNLERLGNPEKYITKIKNGADSIGMEIVSRKELITQNPSDKLIQPFLDFEYEVSFYYLNDDFQYALYAPKKDKRWELQEYHPSHEDLDFSKQFIQWNAIKTGITRVDACRMKDGTLLLVELEDLNPFLSIQLLPKEKQEMFINNWITKLNELL